MVVGSPTTDLLESVDCLLRDCECYSPNADQNMAQNLIVQLQVTIDSVHGLLNDLDRGEAGNTARILVLQNLVIQPWTFLRRWELLAIIKLHLAHLFALSEDCQRFLMEVQESTDLVMKYLYLSAGDSPEYHVIYLASNNRN